jgi:hypothetical protein
LINSWIILYPFLARPVKIESFLTVILKKPGSDVPAEKPSKFRLDELKRKLSFNFYVSILVKN